MPVGSAIDLRLLELDELAEELGAVMNDCPAPLRMDLSNPSSPFE